jgi:hypothetical protein
MQLPPPIWVDHAVLQKARMRRLNFEIGLMLAAAGLALGLTIYIAFLRWIY